MTAKILIYTQDVGGARCLAPVIAELGKTGVAFHHAQHPLSAFLFETGTSSCELLKNLPVDVNFWRDTINQGGFTHVLCTLSSPYLDASNANLILAARECGIPSLGLMDHWKGYDRFYDNNGQPAYFPDFVGCIDSIARDEFKKHGLADSRVSIVGHPGLEKIVIKGQNKLGHHQSPENLLLVSQPIVSDRSFRGIFFSPFNNTTLIDKIHQKLSKKHIKTIGYRPHPKETFAEIPADMVRETGSFESVIEKYSFFLGFDSMMLFETWLLGKSVLVLKLSEVDTGSDSLIPYKYGFEIRNIENLPETMLHLSKNNGISESLLKVQNVFLGSLNRGMDFIKEVFQL